jgi:glucose-6-phosphate 1-dehydrogenase
LFRNNFLPANSIIVGYARTKMDKEEFHKRVARYIKTIGAAQEKKLKEFLVVAFIKPR